MKNNKELTEQFVKAGARAFLIGIRKKLDAMVTDEKVLSATAELMLAEAE